MTKILINNSNYYLNVVLLLTKLFERKFVETLFHATFLTTSINLSFLTLAYERKRFRIFWLDIYKFQTFRQFTNSPKSGWNTGSSVPGAIKLDHLQPSKPILFWNFSNFFTFILGSQFLLPQRANNGKGKFSQLSIWMRLRGFSA